MKKNLDKFYEDEDNDKLMMKQSIELLEKDADQKLDHKELNEHVSLNLFVYRKRD